MEAAASSNDRRWFPSDAAWLAIPRTAGRLLLRHWPQLLFWGVLQWLLYGLAMQLSIELARASLLLAYAGIALLVVTQLACVIAMFLSLRPSLPLSGQMVLATTGAAGNGASALALALLPFVAYYAIWGLLDGVRRDFRLAYLNSVWHTHREPIENLLAVEGLWIALIIAVLVRHFARWRLAGNEVKLPRALVVAVCDTYWILVGMTAIRLGLSRLSRAWEQTVAHNTVVGWWENPTLFDISLEPAKRLVDPAIDFGSTAVTAMLPALVWLAITALVYGLDLRSNQRIDRTNAQLKLAARRYRNMPYLVRSVTAALNSGWVRRITPLVNSIRLVLRAGLPALLTLCIGWQLLALIDSWAWRIAVERVGPLEPGQWRMLEQWIAVLFQGAMDTRSGAITTMLRIVLLAATLEQALSRLSYLRAKQR